MAGYDSDAKKYFDGLVKIFDATRSVNNNQLMAWLITEKEDGGGKLGSATDGDLDVAYGLLLAHAQWGSEGSINYLAKARQMINQGVKSSLIASSTKRLMLGDWDKNAYSSRPSDWMPGHLKAFHSFTNDVVFLQTVDTILSLSRQLQLVYASESGLLPDFVLGQVVQPAHANFLEGPYDGAYNWNACRVPWRMAVDFFHYNDAQTRGILERINTWIVLKTAGNPQQIKSGYYLNGTMIPGRNYLSMAYAAPLTLSGIISGSNQNWLTLGWEMMKSSKTSYYPDSINLLSMLLLSGNWWSPDEDVR